MATLRDIRKRLRSVENVKQITKAMEMVAASHLRKAHLKIEQIRPYATKMQEMLRHLAAASVEIAHPLMQKRKVKRVGVVIISSDKGLCGSYNTHLFKAVDHFLKKYAAEKIKLIVLGRKGVHHYQSKKWDISRQMIDWSGKISQKGIEEFKDELVTSFLKGEFDEIWLIYTRYITAASRQVVVEKFLNIEKDLHQTLWLPDYIFEPDAEAVYREIVERYCLVKVQSALDEAYASELAARTFSMRAATKNAEEVIEKLTLERNKVRQSSITKELLEITAGAEGLK